MINAVVVVNSRYCRGPRAKAPPESVTSESTTCTKRCCCCFRCCLRCDHRGLPAAAVVVMAAAAKPRLWCTRECLVRWSDRENRLSHTSHPYGLTPECERQCRESSSDREKRHVQPGHMQPYGFSPECLRMCTCYE